ncbi:MAG: tetratricopeptide repeat protein [Verrucomicrobia bacterium]|nr:tetratricopeptide repeat protein [Verrucomicrobiota bacterium]
MKRKDELRDIYQSDPHDFEKDFTPQVKQEIIEQRQRDLQRTRTASLFFGGLALLVSVALTAIVIRDFLNERTVSRKVPTREVAFIPRHTLPSEATWVMEYQQVADQGGDEGVPGEKPLSSKWVKKAAYHIIMGQQALSMNEPDTALENFQKVVEIYPEIEGLHRSMGMLCIQREEYAKAAEYLEQALKEEESFDVVNNLGTAYIGAKEYEKAEKNLLHALELQPESPICHRNLALLYRKMGTPDSAIFHYEKYIDLRPNDLDALQDYALYLTKLARWKEAAEFLTELTREVTNVAPIYFLLAQVQVQNGQQAKAMAALQRGIQLVDPDLALAWMSRDEFNVVRDSSDFKKLVDELEISAVSLDGIQ